MFYKVDSTRVTLREYVWSSPMLLLPIVLPIAIVLKLLRIRLPSSMVVPDSLEPFLVNLTDIPEDIRAKIQPLEDQMRECGFVEPLCHWICDPYSSRRVCTVTFRHQSGTALGQICFRQQGARRPPKEVLYPAFLTAYHDGSFFESTAGRREMQQPPECKVQRVVGASLPDLWRLHGKQVSAESFGKTIISANSQEATLTLTNAVYAVERDFHIHRGVLVPRNETEQKAIEGVMATPGDERDRAFAAVYGEIERLANRKASWTSGILILLVTAAIFFAMGSKGVYWKPLVLVIGVLFFHELGHFAAMSVFGYRNLRMFFIPFLGAAVTGQHYNVPGWKKAIVSLAGPVPGIILGAVIATVATYHWPAVLFTAIALLGINAFNLLPIMPLDGGQLMHAVLFSRHPALDVAFRALAAGILVLSGLLGMKVLAIVGVLMLLGLPMTYRVGEVVRRLRKRGFDAISPDGHTIPVETARLIHDELRQVLPASPNARTSAQLTLQSFELLNASPPGWLGSIALIGVHGFSFLAAVTVLVGLVFPWLWGFPHRAISALTGQPKHTLDCGKVLTWEGADALQAGRTAVNTIIADFPSRQEAEEWYRDNAARLPSQTSAVLFGQTVLVALPAGNDEAREHWFKEVDARCGNVSVHSAISRPPFALTCKAPNADIAERLVREADAYFSISSSMYLIPPWSPEQRLSDDDRKARRTYLAIRQQCASCSSDQRWISLSKTILDAERRGDVQAVRRLSKERERVVLEIDKEKLQRLRDEGKDTWDTSFVDLYEKSPEPKQADPLDDEGTIDAAKFAASSAAYRKEIEQWWIRLGSRMGQLSMDGNTPTPRATRFSASWGTVVHTDRTIRFDTTFEQPSVGVPALVKWLSENGCDDLKYEFRLVRREE